MFDVITNPEHYAKASVTCSIKYEPIELAELYNFNLGCAIKYILRAPYKNNFTQDFKKARFFLERVKLVFDRAASSTARIMAAPSDKSLYIFTAFRNQNTYIHTLIDQGGTVVGDSVKNTIQLLDAYIAEHQE